MIGALLAARFLAHKPWPIAALFWAILFVLGIVTSTLIGPNIVVLFIIGLILFLGVTWYYLHVHPVFLGISMYMAAFIFDLIIGFGLAMLGIALPW